MIDNIDDNNNNVNKYCTITKYPAEEMVDLHLGVRLIPSTSSSSKRTKLKITAANRKSETLMQNSYNRLPTTKVDSLKENNLNEGYPTVSGSSVGQQIEFACLSWKGKYMNSLDWPAHIRQIRYRPSPPAPKLDMM